LIKKSKLSKKLLKINDNLKNIIIAVNEPVKI